MCSKNGVFLQGLEVQPMQQTEHQSQICRFTVHSRISTPLETEMALFENAEVKELVDSLLLCRCKLCNQLLKDKRMLYKHFKSFHNLFVCDVCLFWEFEFWDEIKLYETFAEFKSHRRKMHTFCNLCEKHFFDLLEARKHCINAHQMCTVCDVLGRKHQYFQNYEELEKHYTSQHYCCTDTLCVKNHCYVYAHKSEMWAHYKNVHKIQKDFNEIHLLTYNQDPKRCDLSEARGVVHEESLFVSNASSVQILNPNMKENATFPNFVNLLQSNMVLSRNRQLVEKAKEGGLLPDFLVSGANESLLKRIKGSTKNFHNEIFTAIKNYQKDLQANANSAENLLKTLIKDLEGILESKMAVYNLLYAVFNEDKAVKKYLPRYMNEIKFPPFEKKENPIEPEIKKNRFKIVDLNNLSKRK